MYDLYGPFVCHLDFCLLVLGKLGLAFYEAYKIRFKKMQLEFWDNHVYRNQLPVWFQNYYSEPYDVGAKHPTSLILS